MNPLIQLQKATPVFFVALVCFGLLPITQAVSPPPDGGYAGGNTAEGQNALLNLTTGGFNTAVGFFSLRANTTNSFNTAIGAGALLANTADQNTATGAGALLSNITGTDNTANGAFALLSNTATGNTAIGSRALLNNTTGGTLGNIQGTAVGPNVAIGWEALESNTVSSANTAVGYQALHSLVTGPMGAEQAGLCTAVGFQALANATGIVNDAFGYQALANLTTGGLNVAIGSRALQQASGCFSNTAVGADAGSSLTTGSHNVLVGTSAGLNVTTASNVICIGSAGNNAPGTYITGINGATIGGGALPVLINGEQLGTSTSSKRFKEDIRPMDKASESILALKPVTFRYKQEIDPKGVPQFGLVAEDVEKVNPNLIVRDKDGKPYSVRYDQVNAMLLNEFLKEHKAFVQEQHKVEKLEATVASLATTVKEQAAHIQKVSAQLEVSKPAQQVVNNP